MLANALAFVALAAAVLAPGALLLRRLPRGPLASATRAAMIAAITLASLGVTAELLAARYRDVPASLTRLGYAEYRPGRLALRGDARWTWSTGNPRWKTFRVVTNADGLRDGPPPNAPRDPSERRVLFVGDSWTFGIGLDADETYPAQTARALATRAPGRRWVALNAGVPGYNAASSVELLEWLVGRYHPAAVVLTVHQSDDYRRDVNDQPRETASALVRFALYRYLRGGALAARYREGVFGHRDAGALDARVARVTPLLRRAADAAAREGCALYVHVICGTPCRDDPFSPAAPPGVRTLVTPWPLHDPVWSIPQDGHPNPVGAAHLAGQIAPVLAADAR